MQNFFTAAKLIAIAVITIGGFVYMGKGEKLEIYLNFLVLFMFDFKKFNVWIVFLSCCMICVLGEIEEISTGFEDTIQSPSLIALAFYDGLWAYDGW